jgi:hypothetical protein
VPTETVWRDDLAVGQQFSEVVEKQDSVAEQAPALLGVRSHYAGGVVIRGLGLRALGLVLAHVAPLVRTRVRRDSPIGHDDHDSCARHATRGSHLSGYLVRTEQVSGQSVDRARPALGNPGCDLDAGRKAQFGENVLDMAFRGPLGDDHLCGNLAVTQPIRDEVGDLEFPSR